MNRAHKIALVPNNKARTYFVRACGVARFAYNWARLEWEKQYQAHLVDPTLPKPEAKELRKQLNAVKREKFPWMLEVTKCAPQQAINNVEVAYARFFDGLGERPAKKKKGKCKDSFYLSNDQFEIQGKRLWIPNLGWVRMTESLRFSGKILSATMLGDVRAKWHVEVEGRIKRVTIKRLPSGKWVASVTYKYTPKPAPEPKLARVGCDVGIRHLVVTNRNERLSNPRHLLQNLVQLARLQRGLKRMTPGSVAYCRRKVRIAKLHERISQARKYHINLWVHRLVSDNQALVLEDLSVRNLIRNGKLSRALLDASLGFIRLRIEQKAAEMGREVIVVGRFYPSSKLCSCCGSIHEELQLSHRRWTCKACGKSHDRDLNAAKNIELWPEKYSDHPRWGTAGTQVEVVSDGDKGQPCLVAPSVKPEGHKPRGHSTSRRSDSN